jgi:hypothetical protein
MVPLWHHIFLPAPSCTPLKKNEKSMYLAHEVVGHSDQHARAVAIMRVTAAATAVTAFDVRPTR